MGTTATVNAVEAERAELAWLLASGVLGRSNNLARMLTFICEKYFEGHEDQIKEYTIAVEALGRRPDFDPHVDTIVRVTAHSLRKRLQEVYQHEGAGRPMHIVIPPGNYVPSFVPNTAPQILSPEEADIAPQPESAPPVPQSPAGLPEPPTRVGSRPSWLVPAAFVALVALFAAFLISRHRDGRNLQTPVESSGALLAAGSPAAARLLLGSDRKPYVDHSGNTWSPTGFCNGGNSISLPAQTIGATEDPDIYLGGIRGIAHCMFPVQPGVYELHLHFAETTSLPPATRVAVVSVNARPNMPFDVVDEAGGDGLATSYVMTGVRPENDGTIHLDYISETSLLNAVEIMPAASETLLPVRIVADSSAFTDADRQVWLSDRYFTGGRRGQNSRTSKTAGLGIYSGDRVGHFRYNIPVMPREKYRVRLFFREPWFGKQNGASGGPGSRVFDVSANGAVLLKNFDVIAEGGSDPVIKTFDNIESTALGRLELSFTPVVNYPFVNAIEVIPEPQP